MLGKCSTTDLHLQLLGFFQDGMYMEGLRLQLSPDRQILFPKLYGRQSTLIMTILRTTAE